MRRMVGIFFGSSAKPASIASMASSGVSGLSLTKTMWRSVATFAGFFFFGLHTFFLRCMTASVTSTPAQAPATAATAWARAGAIFRGRLSESPTCRQRRH